jgi:hypothetical protein
MKKRRSMIALLGMIMAGVAIAGFGAPAYAAESAPDRAIAAEVVLSAVTARDNPSTTVPADPH